MSGENIHEAAELVAFALTELERVPPHVEHAITALHSALLELGHLRIIRKDNGHLS